MNLIERVRIMGYNNMNLSKNLDKGFCDAHMMTDVFCGVTFFILVVLNLNLYAYDK